MYETFSEIYLPYSNRDKTHMFHNQNSKTFCEYVSRLFPAWVQLEKKSPHIPVQKAVKSKGHLENFLKIIFRNFSPSIVTGIKTTISQPI